MNPVTRLAVRQVQPEWMDRHDLNAQTHANALRGLARINRWSRASAAIWRLLDPLARTRPRPLRVLDIATGGGDVVCDLACRAQRRGLALEFSGCDISSAAIDVARQLAANCDVKVSFFTLDALHDPLPGGFDVIISSLFLHHLREAQAVTLLRRMGQCSREMVVISDLRRSMAGLCLAYVATQLLSRSPVVHFDGPRSVENAFTAAEIRSVAAQAGLVNAEICDCWPQRFLLCWRKERTTQ